MDKISTRFLTYAEIDVDNDDLYEDIFFSQSDTVFIRIVLNKMELEPSQEVVNRIMNVV